MAQVVSILLFLGALLIGGLGVLFLSNATTGVGLLASACLCGILARLAQASHHQQQIRFWVEQSRQPPAAQ